ncbi:MAG: T9SS type A sorting domain-containing protein [Bacteroidia bacterium]|nr:T9SS type A sorting domain-containing protein [Bacteroidia bacterium]
MKKTAVSYVNGLSVTFYFYLLLYGLSHAQCMSGPPPAPCSGGNGPLVSNANVNGGETYYYSGSGTISNVNMNGGTIQVCGTLTINSFNFNNGQVIVESGGSLTITNGFNMNGSSGLINRGLLHITGNVIMQNGNNFIMNLGSSALLQINSAGTHLELEAATDHFVNEGTADIFDLYIDQVSSGNICLAHNSCLQAQNIHNNALNPVTASGQTAAISVGQQIYLNQPLTNDTALVVCMYPGSIKDGPAPYGTAHVYNNCPSCSFALPASVVSFLAWVNGRDVHIEWTTASETNNAYFSIERSSNSTNWEEIKTINGLGHSNKTAHYTYTDAGVPAGTWYYRLRQTDYNGQFEVFAPLSVLVQSASDAKFSVYPVPFSTQLSVQFSGEEDSHLVEILNGVGQVISSTRVNGNLAQLSTENLQPGFYFVRSGTETLKVIKKG